MEILTVFGKGENWSCTCNEQNKDLNKKQSEKDKKQQLALLGKPLHHLTQSQSLVSPGMASVIPSLLHTKLPTSRSHLTNQLFAVHRMFFKSKLKGEIMVQWQGHCSSCSAFSGGRKETFLMSDQQIIFSGVLRGAFASEVWKAMQMLSMATFWREFLNCWMLWQWQSEITDYDGITLEYITNLQLLSLHFPGENTHKKKKGCQSVVLFITGWPDSAFWTSHCEKWSLTCSNSLADPLFSTSISKHRFKKSRNIGDSFSGFWSSGVPLVAIKYKACKMKNKV